MLTKEKLKAMSPEESKKAIMIERIKCFVNYKYMIETYFTVQSGEKRIPFKLYPHQEDALEAYQKYQNNITMKTRQMGFTTFTSAFIAAEIINKNGFKVLVISKQMTNAKDFIKNIKDILDKCRETTDISDNAKEPISWLVPDYKDGYNAKESFTLTNESFVRAESTNENAGRGISGLNLAVVDEVAFIDNKTPEKMNDIWAALGPAMATVKGRSIMISTPSGSNGWYYDTYTNAKAMGFNIIDAHWTKHPLFNQGQYQWIVDESHVNGGYIKYYNETWPETLFDKDTKTYMRVEKDTYSFVCDGKIRSPWYDAESKKLGPRKTACELDCSFIGTGGEVLDQVMLRAMSTYAPTCTYSIPYTLGLFAKYKEFQAPRPEGRYVIAADVATGDGSDYSTVTVLDLITLQICGTFKCQIIPSVFAKILFELGKRFNWAHLVVENAGGGGTTLQELKDLSYPSVYYSTLNKKDESLGVKKRKIGLWVSEEVRAKGGDKLEEYLRTNKVVIPCVDLVEEFFNWIWDTDGKRRHAAGKHDDLIMSLQHAVYYHAYVFKRNERNRSNFQNNFGVQRNGLAESSYYGPNGQGGLIQEINSTPIGLEKRNNGKDVIRGGQRVNPPNGEIPRRFVRFI